MKVEVKKSHTHGLGVFAIKDIDNGEIVLKWDISQEISPDQEKNMSPEEKKYVCFLNGKYIQMQAPECYMNHSCEANTKAENFCDIAIRDIKQGEEITGNYNEVSSGGPVIDCTCGSNKCVGKIFS